MRAAVERVAVRALLSTLRIPPQPPLLLLLLSRMMSSPAPCGGVQPRHKHWLLGPANHVMVSRRHEENEACDAAHREKGQAMAPPLVHSLPTCTEGNASPR